MEPQDILVVGAGPAGLSLACALRESGLKVTLLEQQSRDTLEQPAFDGREIALTHHSRQLMQSMGMWTRLGDEHISPLRDALVLDGHPGPGQARMRIGHEHAAQHPGELGYLVSNHRIRQAAFEAAMAENGSSPGLPPTLRCNAQVQHIHVDQDGASVTLSDGETLKARLLVAADSRHSSTRRAMGISADMHDYGRTMLVCAMTHDVDHEHAAWEWFDHGQTLALLPMNPCPVSGRHRASVVLTLPHQAIQGLMVLPDDQFNTAITERFGHQLGQMQLVSTRHAYPLVGVWARQLVGTRFAAIGDAAVGMHPVTAHGFNLGLRSVETLSTLLRKAHAGGQDIADWRLLQRYQRTHQGNARGLYMATHALATLYTREAEPARMLRKVMVKFGERFTPFKRVVASSLTGLN